MSRRWEGAGGGGGGFWPVWLAVPPFAGSHTDTAHAHNLQGRVRRWHGGEREWLRPVLGVRQRVQDIPVAVGAEALLDGMAAVAFGYRPLALMMGRQPSQAGLARI